MMSDELRQPEEVSSQGAGPSAPAPSSPNPSPAAEQDPELFDPLSAMTPRLNLFFRWFARRYFRHFDLPDDAVARLREHEARGSVIYVMRYSSRLDYLLFNTLFKREGLRLSSFANGLHFYYYRPVLQMLRSVFSRKRGRSQAVVHTEDQRYVRQLTKAGQSFFLFMRTRRLRTFLRGVSRSRHRQDELDLIQEVVREVWSTGEEVYVVPLSIFWRKGPRRANRFLNLNYGSLSRPSDIAKVGSFLATYRDLSVKMAEPIDLRAYITDHRDDGQERVARVVRRSILIYLYREEKVVEGPTLRSTQHVLREILNDGGVRSAMEERASQKRGSMEKAERDVEKMVREIAARQSSTLLAILAALVGWIIRRMFSKVEINGLDKVAEYAKRHPLVLIPTHRSYFDFLIVSLMFYYNYLVPPHIAARDNMAFGPFGMIFRMAGAFYLRRSFDDPLYKQVFRAYVAYLVREGFTQEFFIEGGRSRTGKTLSPRLGMLTWDVDAFLECSRRDLFIVPIAITYERLVEEGGMVDELEGGEKTQESTLALFKARKYLQGRFGTVHVNFGEPISLDDAMGDRRSPFERQVRGEVKALLPEGSDEEVAALEEKIEAEKRDFIDGLAHRIVERMNWSVVANATSVVAAVLMGIDHRGLLREPLVALAQQMVDLLRIQDVRLTSALAADREDFADSIAFMLRADLIESAEDPRGEVLYYQPSRRRALDIYRNSIVHFLATPSFLARGLMMGASLKELREELTSWQDILYQEYFVPRADVLASDAEGFIEYFEARGWVDRSDDMLLATAEGEPILRCLVAQSQGVIECYEVACRVFLHAEDEISKKDFLARCVAGFERSEVLGLASCEEAANDTTFNNALDLLVRRQIVQTRRVPRRSGAPDVLIAPGENFGALTELEDRLAAAVVAR
jgi:glycerol-3-phosphate O-acyltransferase